MGIKSTLQKEGLKMYECWAWIDGEWLRGWDVGDTENGIKFRPEQCMKDDYQIDSWQTDYSKHYKPNYIPEKLKNAK